ncbi:MAG: diphosphomevalonate decarboxylase [Anaerolineales bacterium]|nr:diphosphomevalonate decarboxylase [Anaerolineales bacterium]
MEKTRSASAIARANIALIKYWGNHDANLRLPANSSISLTLDGLETKTRVSFDDSLPADQIHINGVSADEESRSRVATHLDRIRRLAGISSFAIVESQNNFPSGAGLASSSSAFAALTLAGVVAAGMQPDRKDLSRIARMGSGSACRSVLGGYVIWYAAQSDTESFAEQLAPREHWHLVDLIAIVDRQHKHTGSTLGHSLADTSPLQPARVSDAARRIEICRRAILERDFQELASVVEQDSNLMHAVMLTSTPPLMYWTPQTLEVMRAVYDWRDEGFDVCYTLDAGPNVHCLCTFHHAEEVKNRLEHIPGILEILEAHPGEQAQLIEVEGNPSH